MTEFTAEFISSWRNVISYDVNNTGETTVHQNLILDCLDHIERQAQRIVELEQERRWIPFSEWEHKEDGIYVYKRLNNVIELAHFEHDVKPYYSKYIKNVFNMRIPLPPSWKED